MRVLLMLLSLAAAQPAQAAPKYLLFYLSGGKPALMDVPASIETSAHTEAAIDDVLRAVGSNGDHVRSQLGFSVGPLMFDLSDNQMRSLIADSFRLAEKKGVAVAFHIEDSMFWNARKDLWSNKDNVEWLDWNGATRPHRIIGWVADGKPVLAPQMCFNSPSIKAEARRLAREVIGPAVKKGVNRLDAIGKPYLFAGVIAGWETRLQDDAGKSADDTEPEYGYHALRNLGYSREKPPADRGAALQGVVVDWIALWARALEEGGVPRDAVYTHIASPAIEPPTDVIGASKALRFAYKHASPDVAAFSKYARPGFSVYGADGFSALHKILARHPAGPWAVSEGTNVDLANSFGGGNTESRSGMERYLARAFNHGAVLVNLYGWNTSPDGDGFAKATSGAQAVSAYRKFLSGAKLSEGAATARAAGDSLPAKIQRIQADLPPWVRRHPERQRDVQALMPRLDAAMRAGDAAQADRLAVEILALIGR